jgi:hypothetical protein
MEQMKANMVISRINSFERFDKLVDFYLMEYLPKADIDSPVHRKVRRAFVDKLCRM